ncbi:hypothetical protein Z043_119341 [Scleropages formosus]|uniref:Ig-like domain-containing protein n=1 Tax=Scleropages formosus TaxID=113540 RepID=A0A0P7U5A8_SCLFO|nr:hypothetical protein Z043_119341 [Scleropages formosus]
MSLTSGAELSFTLEPSDIIAVQEQPLMLPCQVDGVPPITTQWRRNGKPLPEDHSYTMLPNGSLLIGHFQRTKSDGSSDEGDYECVAQNAFGLLLSRKARVQAANVVPPSIYHHPLSSQVAPAALVDYGSRGEGGARMLRCRRCADITLGSLLSGSLMASVRPQYFSI